MSMQPLPRITAGMHEAAPTGETEGYITRHEHFRPLLVGAVGVGAVVAVGKLFGPDIMEWTLSNLTKLAGISGE